MYKSIHCVSFFLPFPLLFLFLSNGILVRVCYAVFFFLFPFLDAFPFFCSFGEDGTGVFFFLRFLSPFAGFDGLLL